MKKNAALLQHLLLTKTARAADLVRTFGPGAALTAGAGLAGAGLYNYGRPAAGAVLRGVGAATEGVGSSVRSAGEFISPDTIQAAKSGFKSDKTQQSDGDTRTLLQRYSDLPTWQQYAIPAAGVASAGGLALLLKRLFSDD